MEANQEIMLIENGDLFEGTFDQFEDCFFSFPKNFSTEDKLESVKEWCKSNNYTFSWSYSLIPYTKSDGSGWLGNKLIKS